MDDQVTWWLHGYLRVRPANAASVATSPRRLISHNLLFDTLVIGIVSSLLLPLTTPTLCSEALALSCIMRPVMAGEPAGHLEPISDEFSRIPGRLTFFS